MRYFFFILMFVVGLTTKLWGQAGVTESKERYSISKVETIDLRTGVSSTKNYTDGEAYLQWESVKLSPSRTEDNIFIAIHGSLQYKFMDLATRLGDTTMGGRYKLPGYTYEFSNLNGECRRDYTTSIWDEVKYEFWDYQYVVAHDRTKGMASAFKYTFENDRKRIVIHLRPKFKKNILPDLSKPL